MGKQKFPQCLSRSLSFLCLFGLGLFEELYPLLEICDGGGGVGPDLVRLQLHPAVVGELVREDGHQGDLEDGTAEGLPEARLLLRRAQVAWWRGLGIVAAREGDSEGRSSWSSGSRERAQHCSHHGLLRTDVVSVDLG